MWPRTATIQVCLLAAILVCPHSEAAQNKLTPPDNTQCACPNDVLTFTCSIVGGGNTLWRGSAFNCPSTTNEIILRHSRFGSGGTSGSCNSEAIVGRSLGVENGNCFISELSVTASESLNDGVVQCDYNSNTGTVNIGSETLNVVYAANPYPPPNDVSLIKIDQGLVTFNWSSVPASCSFMGYVISSDCGDCPSSTNSTNVTCSGLQLPTQSDGVVCSFNVSSRVCGILGNQSSSVLAVPDVPRVLSIIPQYTNESQALKNMFVNINMSDTGEVINNDISGTVTIYIAAYTTLTALVNTSIPAESVSCEDDVCTFTVAVPLSVCSSSNEITITISAANRIGQGSSSDTVTIGCTNTFVSVNFNSTTSIFSCQFLHKLDNSVKSCAIFYEMCGQELNKSVEGNSTPENSNVVLLKLDVPKDGTYCYNLTASNNRTTVKLQGNLTKRTNTRVNTSAIILGITIPLAVIFLVCLTILCILISVIIIRHGRSRTDYVEMKSREEPPCLKLNKRNFRSYQVNKDCALRDFIEEQKPELKFWRGRVFYELTEEEEYITDDKELIFQEEKTGELLLPDVGSTILKGEGISKSKINVDDKYRVFVQSKGSGARHIANGTHILYEEQVKRQSELSLEEEVPLLPLPSKYFDVAKVVEETTTIGKFCDGHRVRKKKQNIFLELDKVQLKPEQIRDVFLRDKTGKYFTGPSARKMVEMHDEEKLKNFEVFVMCNDAYYDEHHKLTKDQSVLYEDPSNYTEEKFHIWKVDDSKDNIRMSEFVRRKLGPGSFKRGRAFYEFTKKEDLTCCRKIIRAPMGKLRKNDSEEMLLATIETFYIIPGTPEMGVSPPELPNFRDFVHCQSQGSRCLKKGDILLYKVQESEVDKPAKNKAAVQQSATEEVKTSSK